MAWVGMKVVAVELVFSLVKKNSHLLALLMFCFFKSWSDIHTYPLQVFFNSTDPQELPHRNAKREPALSSSPARSENRLVELPGCILKSRSLQQQSRVRLNTEAELHRR